MSRSEPASNRVTIRKYKCEAGRVPASSFEPSCSTKVTFQTHYLFFPQFLLCYRFPLAHSQRILRGFQAQKCLLRIANRESTSRGQPLRTEASPCSFWAARRSSLFLCDWHFLSSPNRA